MDAIEGSDDGDVNPALAVHLRAAISRVLTAAFVMDNVLAASKTHRWQGFAKRSNTRPIVTFSNEMSTLQIDKLVKPAHLTKQPIL